MKKIILINKKLGSTPLEAIDEFRKINSEYRNEAISYAGRLDPMADGLLLLLVGEENKYRKKYESLSKNYEAEFVLGVTTDTYDALGIIEKVNIKKIGREDIKKTLESFIGKQKQKYPHYSSMTVNGKPLYWWSRRNKLSEIVIPEKEVEIYSLEVLGLSFISCSDLVAEITKRIREVKGDFRQDEIIKRWEGFGEKYAGEKFRTVKIKVSCSSGTYVRKLASDVGEKIFCGAFALSIKRIGIGDYVLEDGLGISDSCKNE